MIKCICDFICNLLGLMAEKNAQAEEVIEQQTEIINQQSEICECLEAVTDPDAECPVCPVTYHTFRFWAFDEANGIFDEDYVHTSTVNGTAYSNPFSAGWTSKSEAYETTTDAVNAIPGVTMTLVQDYGLTENGKPEYKITYPVGQTVTIVNTHTGDTYTFGTAEDGVTCVATVVDGDGNPISSYTPVEL